MKSKSTTSNSIAGKDAIGCGLKYIYTANQTLLLPMPYPTSGSGVNPGMALQAVSWTPEGYSNAYVHKTVATQSSGISQLADIWVFGDPKLMIDLNHFPWNIGYVLAGSLVFVQMYAEKLVDATAYAGDEAVYSYNSTTNTLGLQYANIDGEGRLDYAATGFSRIFYAKDHLGSVCRTYDQSGNLVEAHDYYPYGEMIVLHEGSNKTREEFTDKEMDDDGTQNGGAGIHLNYFGARMYDPKIGVWNGNDPAEQFWGGYGYCGGDPVNYVDPDGRSDFLYSDNHTEHVEDGTDFQYMQNGTADGMPVWDPISTNYQYSDMNVQGYNPNAGYVGAIHDLGDWNTGLTAISLGLLLFPPTIPLGAAGLGTTGIIGLGMDYTESGLTGNYKKAAVSTVCFVGGIGAGKAIIASGLPARAVGVTKNSAGRLITASSKNPFIAKSVLKNSNTISEQAAGAAVGIPAMIINSNSSK